VTGAQLAHGSLQLPVQLQVAAATTVLREEEVEGVQENSPTSGETQVGLTEPHTEVPRAMFW
jgi:hypothetical protein